MNNFNKKHLIPFILFIFLCILIYSKFGIIEVKAYTYDSINSEKGYTRFNFYDHNTWYYASARNTEKLTFSSSIPTHTANGFITLIYFNNLNLETLRNDLNAKFYITYHFKYYYDITDTEAFNFSELVDYISNVYGTYNIYEEQLYTSVNENNIVSYDAFITLQLDSYFHSALFTEQNETEPCIIIELPLANRTQNKILNFNSSVEIVNAFVTDDEDLTPLSIVDYIQNINSTQGITYYSPDALPFTSSGDTVSYLLLTKALIQQKLGILYFPIDIIKEIFTKFYDLDNSTGVIHIPNIYEPFYHKLIISEQNFNILSIFSSNGLVSVYNIYLFVVDVILIFMFLNFCISKLKEFFRR